MNESLSELYATEFENVSTKYDGALGVLQHEKDMLDEYITRSERQGYITSSGYYMRLMTNGTKQIDELKKQREEQYSALSSAMNSGTIDKYSEQWYEMVNAIDETTLSITELESAQRDYAKSIKEISWQIFDLIQERISNITSEAEFLIDLMSNKKLYDDKGQFTDDGLATMGLHGANYNVYMAQADKYAQELAKINRDLEISPYDQDIVDRRQELLELQQESILAAGDEKEAIRSMVEEGIELELSALEELIDKYNEALDSQKD